jgi:putative spermidine/putrescine transport system permease protein
MSLHSRSDGSERAWGPFILSVTSWLTLLFLLLPVLVIVPLSFSSRRYLEFPPQGFSFQWYASFFSNHTWTAATWASFKIAFLVTALSTTLGTLASFFFVRARCRWKNLAYSFALSPMIVPAIVVAIAFYFFFAKLKLIGSLAGMVLAHSVLAVPYVIVIVTATLQGFDVNLERAAMSLGANRLKTFFKVTFPLVRPGILSGALFAFLTSFDEVIIAIFISGTTTGTLPKKMWESITMETDPTLTAIATMLIVLTVAVLCLIELLRRRMNARQGGGPPPGA